MASFKTIIPLTPRPKASVRVGRYGSYNPSQKEMDKITQLVKSQLRGVEGALLQGPLLVIYHFHLPLPGICKGLKRPLKHMTPHNKRPDIDNLMKFVNDALNGVLWRDDSQIAYCMMTKSFTQDKKGYTELYAKELGDAKYNFDEIQKLINEFLRPNGD